MPTEFFTGFEGCSDVDSARSMFDSYGGYLNYSATSGYDGSKCIGSGDSSGAYGRVNIAAAKTVVAGFHVRGALQYNLATYGYSAYSKDKLLFFAGPNISIFNTATGIYVFRDSTQIGTTANTISVDIHHLEVKIFSDATVGTLTIKKDGVATPILALTGLNTGGQDVTAVDFGMIDVGHYLDNLFVAPDWEGELKTFLSRPISDSSVSFTPSSGTDNFAMVDDETPDGDTTYVSYSTVGAKDLYGMTDCPAGAIIKGVTVVTIARKDDVGARQIAAIANQDATDYQLATIDLTNEYPTANHPGIITLPLAPDGTAWTAAKLNGITLGLEVTA